MSAEYDHIVSMLFKFEFCETVSLGSILGDVRPLYFKCCEVVLRGRSEGPKLGKIVSIRVEILSSSGFSDTLILDQVTSVAWLKGLGFNDVY